MGKLLGVHISRMHQLLSPLHTRQQQFVFFVLGKVDELLGVLSHSLHQLLRPLSAQSGRMGRNAVPVVPAGARKRVSHLQRHRMSQLYRQLRRGRVQFRLRALRGALDSLRIVQLNRVF